MKTLTLDQLAPAFAEILVRFAGLYDLPELSSARIVRNDENDSKRHLLSTHALVAPRGQLSAIVEQLEVRVTLDRWDDTPKLFSVSLDYSYKHVGGGSNGKSVRFILAVETRFGQDSVAEVKALVEADAFRAIQKAI